MTETGSPSLQNRFFKKVQKTDGCWLWLGAKATHFGYGVLWSSDERKFRVAHRISWELHRGPIPCGMFVLHHCDNPICVNPDHLFLGTHQDNVADKVKKGRHLINAGSVIGERVGTSKLTNDNVISIRGDIRSNRVLAKEYGVSREAIRKIKRRISWGHLP